MHEFSICSALLEQVAALAGNRGASAVQRITIEVGPLSGVDPALLQAAFTVLRAGGCSAEAGLCIDTPAVRIRCMACGVESITPPNRLACTQCTSIRSRIVEGDELRLRRVEMSVPAVPPEQAVRNAASIH